MTSVRSDTGTRRRRLGRVVTVIVVAVFGLLWWAPWHTGGHADSGDPGGIRLAELDRAVDQVLSAAGTPPASRQEREPFWDSCDGMKGTFGWDDLGVTVRWSATAPPPAATAVAAVLEGQGWKRTDLVNTVRWTKTLTSGSLARAFFEPDNVGPVLLLTASPVPPPASGC